MAEETNPMAEEANPTEERDRLRAEKQEELAAMQAELDALGMVEPARTRLIHRIRDKAAEIAELGRKNTQTQHIPIVGSE